MSDLSGISHDYALNAEFAGKFNEMVIKLKRAFLVDKAGTATEHFNQTRNGMTLILKKLVGIINGNAGEGDNPESQIPTDVIERLKKQTESQVEAHREVWEKIISDLEAGQDLSEDSFEALDDICEIADSTTSAAFRRLRRF